MGALNKIVGQLQSLAGRRKMRVGAATDDGSLERDGQTEQEAGDLRQAENDETAPEP
jgi:uncharacterized protein YjbJ (UPF0337 family)